MFYGPGTLISPSATIPSEAISFSGSASSNTATGTGVLNSLSGMALQASGGSSVDYYGSSIAYYGQNSANYANVIVENIGLQYSTFGLISVRPFTPNDPTITPSGASSAIGQYTPGNQTDAAFSGGSMLTINMPTSGVATYYGTIIGKSQSYYPIHGTAALAVNFSSGNVIGQFDYSGGPSQDSVSMLAKVGANGFAGITVSASGLSGTAVGHFYGPSANELTGALNLTGVNTVNPSSAISSGGGATMTVVASFGAKKQ